MFPGAGEHELSQPAVSLGWLVPEPTQPKLQEFKDDQNHLSADEVSLGPRHDGKLCHLLIRLESKHDTCLQLSETVFSRISCLECRVNRSVSL